MSTQELLQGFEGTSQEEFQHFVRFSSNTLPWKKPDLIYVNSTQHNLGPCSGARHPPIPMVMQTKFDQLIFELTQARRLGDETCEHLLWSSYQHFPLAKSLGLWKHLGNETGLARALLQEITSEH